MEAFVRTANSEEVKRPVTTVGVIGWMRANLFNSPFNSVLTLLFLGFLYLTVPPFIKWAFIGCLWDSTGQQCKAIDGACWSVVTKNLRFILFGFYPWDQQWRPVLSIGLLFGLFYYSLAKLGAAWHDMTISLVFAAIMSHLTPGMTWLSLALYGCTEWYK